jgi:hypothetical protein
MTTRRRLDPPREPLSHSLAGGGAPETRSRGAPAGAPRTAPQDTPRPAIVAAGHGEEPSRSEWPRKTLRGLRPGDHDDGRHDA